MYTLFCSGGLLRQPALMLLAALAVASGPATAQQQAQNLFTDAAVTQVTSNQARLSLNFGAEAPAYRIDGNDRPHVEFRLRNTRNVAIDANGAPRNNLNLYLARGVQLRPDGQDLVLVMDADAPLHIGVSTTQRRRLVLTIDEAVVTGAGPGPDAGNITTADAGIGSGLLASAGPVLPLAVDPPAGEDGYALIKLKYADVSEIVGLLSNGVSIKSNDSFTPLEPGFGSPGNSGGNSYSPVPSQPQDEDPPLGQAVDSSLSVDRRLNAVWVKGSPEHIARVRDEIEQIDVPVDTVILETQFVELTQAGARNVGIDFTNSAGQIGVATYQSGQFLPGLNYANDRSQATSLSFQAALNAQIQNGQGRIVSQPRIAAQSGASAKIITGDALPILTSITLSGVNGVSQQVQYVNVGVTLQIAPRVSGDGFVNSHVFCVVSSVTGYSQGYPTISQRHAETSATVRDGESFIIGGLSQEAVLESYFHVPFLGDLPFLGRAFGTEKSSKTKTDLYIVITPHIVQHGAPNSGPQ